MITREEYEAGAPQSSPWGFVQSARPVGRGIWTVETASHGGYCIPPRLWEEMRAKWGEAFDRLPFYSPAGWLEEDCEWCLVYLTWPDLAPDDQLRSAWRMVLYLREPFRPTDAEYAAAWAAIGDAFAASPAYGRIGD